MICNIFYSHARGCALHVCGIGDGTIISFYKLCRPRGLHASLHQYGRFDLGFLVRFVLLLVRWRSWLEMARGSVMLHSTAVVLDLTVFPGRDRTRKLRQDSSMNSSAEEKKNLADGGKRKNISRLIIKAFSTTKIPSPNATRRSRLRHSPERLDKNSEG